MKHAFVTTNILHCEIFELVKIDDHLKLSLGAGFWSESSRSNVLTLPAFMLTLRQFMLTFRAFMLTHRALDRV